MADYDYYQCALLSLPLNIVIRCATGSGLSSDIVATFEDVAFALPGDYAFYKCLSVIQPNERGQSLSFKSVKQNGVVLNNYYLVLELHSNISLPNLSTISPLSAAVSSLEFLKSDIDLSQGTDSNLLQQINGESASFI